MKICILFICLLTALTVSAVEVAVQPDLPMAGEPFLLVLSSSKGHPALTQAPDIPGLQWFLNHSNSGYRNINGRATHTSGITVLAEKPGTYTIPAMRVKIGRKTETTRPVTIKVAAADTAMQGPAGSENTHPAVFGRMRIADERNTFYIGEEIPLLLELYIRPGTRVTSMAYPAISIPHAVFRDFRQENPENPRYSKPQESTRTVDGQRFVTVTMRTAFRMLTAGPVTPEAAGEIGLAAAPRQNRSRRSFWDDDDFFSDFFGRQESVRRKITFTGPGAIRILPLPPPPAGADFTGLLGRWEMQFSLDKEDECKVGSLLTLKLRLSGSGTAELLKLPKLNLPGFRVYPEEIRKTPGAIEVAWQLIPLKPGKTQLKLALSTFDPGDGRYHERRFARLLDVAPADRMPAGGATAQAPEMEPHTAPQIHPDPVKTPGTNLLYLAGKPGNHTALPLGTVWQYRYLLLLIGGPVLWGLAEFIMHRRAKLSGSELLRRKQHARSAAKNVLQKLRNAKDDAEWDHIINTEVLPLLSDRFNLPPGSTAVEIAPEITDEKLLQALQAAGENAYLPGAAPRPAINRTAALKALKKLFLLLCLFLALPGRAADKFTAAGAAYDRGDFPEAWKIYQELLNTEGPAAGLLYNAGCAAFMSSAPAAALTYFDAASRLAPRDSAALENLNITRAKLGQSAVGRVESPRDLILFCRDSLRPDEWLLIACMAWFAAFMFLACRRLMAPAVLQSMLGMIGAVIVLALAAYAAEMHGPYAPDRAIIADGGAAMRALPTDSGSAEGGLPAGQEVKILEERGKYVLVRCGTLQGWIPHESCRKIWQMP